jgi:hypothetical protein
MVDDFDNGNNPSNRGRTARDNQATKPLSILQQEVLSLKNLVNEHSKEMQRARPGHGLSCRSPLTGGSIRARYHI